MQKWWRGSWVSALMLRGHGVLLSSATRNDDAPGPLPGAPRVLEVLGNSLEKREAATRSGPQVSVFDRGSVMSSDHGFQHRRAPRAFKSTICARWDLNPQPPGSSLRTLFLLELRAREEDDDTRRVLSRPSHGQAHDEHPRRVDRALDQGHEVDLRAKGLVRELVRSFLAELGAGAPLELLARDRRAVGS